MIGITGKIKKCICPECLQESLYLECFEWKARSFWKNQIDNRNMNGTRSLPKHNHLNNRQEMPGLQEKQQSNACKAHIILSPVSGVMRFFSHSTAYSLTLNYRFNFHATSGNSTSGNSTSGNLTFLDALVLQVSKY